METTVQRSTLFTSSRPVGPTDGIEIEMKPYLNWTKTKEDQVKTELLEKFNKFCALHPRACLLTSNPTLNRTIFNTSHVIIRVINGSNGQTWVRMKVKLPSTVPKIPGSEFLPSVVLKKVVVDSKEPLEKTLGIKIVTVKEVVFDLPTPPPTKYSSPSSSPPVTNTVAPTVLSGYRPVFLPYVLVAVAVVLGLITLITVGVLLYRRNKVHKIRILPKAQSSPIEGHELLVLRSSKPSTPCSTSGAEKTGSKGAWTIPPDSISTQGDLETSDLQGYHENDIEKVAII